MWIVIVHYPEGDPKLAGRFRTRKEAETRRTELLLTYPGDLIRIVEETV